MGVGQLVGRFGEAVGRYLVASKRAFFSRLSHVFMSHQRRVRLVSTKTAR